MHDGKAYVLGDDVTDVLKIKQVEDEVPKQQVKDPAAAIKQRHKKLFKNKVFFQYGFGKSASIKLADYIGNKLLRDQNIRENYAAGLLPLDIAVQRINDISASETQEYIRKIEEEQKSRQPSGYGLFNDKDYYGDESGGGNG